MTTASDVGLDATQFAHAKAIVAAVRARGLPQRVAQIAIAVALAESNLRVYANRNVPASLKLPHEAVGQDHLSVGIFQQQTPMWGTCADCMGVATSTAKFLNALEKVAWRKLPNWLAAQAVQRSAFADGSNYRKHDAHAGRIVAALWGGGPAAPALAPASASGPPPWYHRLLAQRSPMLTGADVTVVQRKVGCPADGVYGPVTRGHLQAFQRAHRLDPDGVVGPLTARALGA